MSTNKVARFENIDIACGLAIMLVVFGHMHFTETVETNWYLTVRSIVYKIHMPLFIFLSGFIAFLSVSKNQIKSSKTYFIFVASKARKFIPAYLFFGFLAIAIDIFLNKISSENLAFDLKALIFFPIQGSAGFIWYLYILFGFYLITPFLVRLKTNSIIILLIISFFITIIELTPYFSLYLFGRYFFFFLGGGILFLHFDKLIHLIQKTGIVFITLLILAFIFELFAKALPYQLLSICFIPTVLYISGNIKSIKVSTILSFTGKGSFAIYLFNSIVINIIYILFHKLFVTFPVNIFILTGLFFGLTLPLLFRFFFNKIIPKRFYVL